MRLNAPVERLGFTMPPPYGVRGVEKIGFWSVANGLTGMDFDGRNKEVCQRRLLKVKEEHGVAGSTPYFCLLQKDNCAAGTRHARG